MTNQYEYHEIANVFPLLDDEALLELAADIEENGLLQAIVLYEGKILDGRNRYRACLESGVTPYFEEYTGHDPVGFVVSYNMRRRHLTTSQRDMVAAKLATMQQGRPETNAQICALTQDQAADLMNVSRRGVQQARKVLDSGDEELISAVDSGVMSVSAAEKEVREREREIREVDYPDPDDEKGEALPVFQAFDSMFSRWLRTLRTASVSRSHTKLDKLAVQAHKAIDEYVKAIKRL